MLLIFSNRLQVIVDRQCLRCAGFRTKLHEVSIDQRLMVYDAYVSYATTLFELHTLQCD